MLAGGIPIGIMFGFLFNKLFLFNDVDNGISLTAGLLRSINKSNVKYGGSLTEPFFTYIKNDNDFMIHYELGLGDIKYYKRYYKKEEWCFLTFHLPADYQIKNVIKGCVVI